MAGELTPAQRAYIRKRTKIEDPDPSDMAGELNIIPFLDIVVNIIMFLLMTTVTVAFFAQLEAQLPTLKHGVGSRGANQDKNALNLSITVTTNGVIVAGSGGKLAPGCDTTETGAVVTVPKHNNQYDWAGLTKCVAKVKKHFEDESKVIVSADPVIPFEHVVHAMDAVRSQGDEELFPDVLLSAGVR